MAAAEQALQSLAVSSGDDFFGWTLGGSIVTTTTNMPRAVGTPGQGRAPSSRAPRGPSGLSARRGAAAQSLPGQHCLQPVGLELHQSGPSGTTTATLGPTKRGVTTTTCTGTTTVAGATYLYEVEVTDLAGTSTPSEPASVPMPAPASTTGGYWEAAADGTIFSFTAPFKDTLAGTTLAKPMVGMAPDTATGGTTRAPIPTAAASSSLHKEVGNLG